MIDIYSDTNQTALKYLKNTEVNIYKFLVIASDFNIRDSSWDPLITFNLAHSDLISDITDFLDFLLSNQVSIRYLDNVNDSNLVINLMFLRPNSSEFDNYTIHPEFQYLSDYALLTVDISIIKEFASDKRCTIIKNSEEEDYLLLNS